ncbi:hypothetical protein BAU15_01030 [Enterococcus sp. JM4C]|uniref:sirohydrochlorin chelatase n=1 Tax=Candidatus Enterococcus huntleyi TaxID=1857217 RepID=UPI00137A4501|nr:CbiX/SirB N-terminal domain-containing protein [Enterococcus sp. JM4C]KAF1299260.1 hypothetical protein BAU15_01030 [Enterococcus sp. JM4C]
MNQGVIFVLHGRKGQVSTKNNAVVQSVIDELSVPGKIGLLEGDEQTLEDAMQALLSLNVQEILFVPVLLFPATHVKEDLPQRAQEFLKDQATYRIAEPLATTDAVENFLVRSIQEAREEENSEKGNSENAQLEVLVIAHGTPHYEEPNLQLKQVAKKVEARLNVPVYTANHIGEERYLDFLEEHQEGLLIQPLFLTDGFLTRKIQTNIQEARGQKDRFLPTMEESPELKEAIVERVRELLCTQS